MISRIWPSAVGFIVRHRPIYLMLFPIIIVRRRVLRILQRILDYFFKNVEAGSLVISIPTFQGSFEMDFRSNLLKRALVEKNFEPDIAQLVKKHVDPFKDVLDIGANVGFYTILFSKIISESNKVLAIEPAPLALEYLRRNIARNGCTQLVLVFEGIATDSKGTYLLNIIPGMEEFSSIGKIVHPQVARKVSESIEVNGDTVDNLVRNFKLNPGFIKIDVEGAEYLVLKGAVNTIHTYHPFIVFELNGLLLSSCSATSRMVLGFLENYGYRCVPTSDGFMAIP